jgi:hypothetical protein
MREINTVKEEELPDMLKDHPPTRTTNAGPNLSIIAMGQDPAEGSQATPSQGPAQNEAINNTTVDAMNQWRQDTTHNSIGNGIYTEVQYKSDYGMDTHGEASNPTYWTGDQHCPT